MISIEQLSKAYGPKTVLNNINLRFDVGKVYGIVGENGAGKTTLFRCLAELERHEGQIHSDINPLKEKLGFLLTNPFFFNKITGREYLQLLCNARKVAPGNLDEKNLFDLPLDHYAVTYSTGMKKKLALNAILLQKNKVFILDEPFNGVDIQSNMLIIEIIKKLKEEGKTILISSHIFATLRNTCDEIHLLKGGEIVKTATPDEFDELEASMIDHRFQHQMNNMSFS